MNDADKIVHLPEDINGYVAGYYFVDETERLVGKFDSHDEALKSFKEYCKRHGF